MPTSATRSGAEPDRALAAKLDRFRAESGLTLREIGERSGLQYGQLGKWFRGEVDPRVGNLARVLPVLGKTWADLDG